MGGGAAAVGLVACDADGPDGPGTALFDEQRSTDAPTGAPTEAGPAASVTQEVAASFDDRSDSIIPALTRLADLEVHVWTVNSVPQMNKMIGMGVDQIITDDPKLLGEVIAHRSTLSQAELTLLRLADSLLEPFR